MRSPRLLRAAAVLAVLALATPALFAASNGQDPTTPPILDAQGQPVRTSISSLEPVVVGDVPQWIAIRGHDIWNPVLLHLDDGPGASHMAWNRQYLSGLERHFIVVSWDARGAGKSFNPRHTDKLTLDRYVADTLEMAHMLAQRFRQERIFLVGHGFGAIVGTLAAQKRPELFHAFVAAGPRPHPAEGDRMAYRFALEHAEKAGDAALTAKLTAQGPPPYAGADMVMKYDTMRDAAATLAGTPANPFRATRAAALQEAPEYSAAERGRLAAARAETHAALSAQVAIVNLPAQAPSLAVPVYFAVGRYDRGNASIAEAYFGRLQAPRKELVWFEASGDFPAYEEPSTFVELLTRVVRDTARRRETTN